MFHGTVNADEAREALEAFHKERYAREEQAFFARTHALSAEHRAYNARRTQDTVPAQENTPLLSHPYTVFFVAPAGFAVAGKTTDRLVMHLRAIDADAAMDRARQHIGPAFRILYATPGFVPGA